MDDSLIDLETELRRLPLLPPSTRLLDRIGSVLVATPSGAAAGCDGRRWLWSGLGLAAALAVVATVGQLRFRSIEAPAAVSGVPKLTAVAAPVVRPVVTAEDRYEPVEATNVLYELRDEGPADLASGQSGRRLRYRYVDTYTWENPCTNGSLTWQVPRDEIRVIPASLPRYFHRSEKFVVQFP